MVRPMDRSDQQRLPKGKRLDQTSLSKQSNLQIFKLIQRISKIISSFKVFFMVSNPLHGCFVF